MLETVRGIINERWKRQPKGFIISTKRLVTKMFTDAGQIITIRAGYRNENTYFEIAHILEDLGGVFFGKASGRGKVNETQSNYSAASMWQFTEDRK